MTRVAAISVVSIFDQVVDRNWIIILSLSSQTDFTLFLPVLIVLSFPFFSGSSTITLEMFNATLLLLFYTVA